MSQRAEELKQKYNIWIWFESSIIIYLNLNIIFTKKSNFQNVKGN
jgi:hypothetical protein